LLYTISSGSAIPAGADAAWGGARVVPGAAPGLAGNGLARVAAGMIAVRAADVACPGGADRAGALLAVPASAGPVASGELLVFAHPVTVAPAVTSRGGVVRAGGWLPDHVRLGELERHLGEGVIENLVAAGIAAGRMPAPQRQRLMSLALTIRLNMAMTLMPDASYTGALQHLAGHLADVPFDREWHVPTSGVVTEWRGKVPPAVMEELFWQVAGPLADDGEHDDGDDGGPVLVLGGMPVCGIDGMLVALADTPANRAMFGCTGTRDQKGPGSAPFPQLLAVVVTARAGRAKLGAITGRARAGEQTLLARLIRRRPDLFAGRVFAFDRNFPGHKIITAILDAGGHVVARAKSDLALPVTPGGWLADGSRLSWLNAPSGKTSDRLPVRVAEHNAVLPCGDGQDVSETCTLITTLLDHHAVSADQIRGAYQSRWPASETTFGEDKTTITGAGDRTSGPVLRSGTPRLAIGEFWAWMTSTQLVRASAAASLTTDAAAARALRRRAESSPVTTDQVSFTAARNHAVSSMIQSKVTAGTSLAALAALAEDTSRAMLHTLVSTGRQRHSPRAQKARPGFPHTSATKKTVTGVPQVTLFQPEPGPG
jgi:Insertion element 4 transposase N-terminal